VNLHSADLADKTLVGPGSPLLPFASRVVLEITERATLEGVDAVEKRIAELREMGFRIAIDDLGAGYAGLTSFAMLEPDIVKLDMTLVRDVEKTPVKAKLIQSLCAVCRDLNVTVVAEGIETVPERDCLIDLGCDLLQGYLLARPGPAFPPFSWGD
jgi:EAL domain-containing protein (putative c-di-GMP-specific phosphodiesterase class I)